MTAVDTFDVGDLVFVGDPAPLHRKNTWRIESFTEAEGVQYAILSSGLTDRFRREPVSNLSHFRLVEGA